MRALSLFCAALAGCLLFCLAAHAQSTQIASANPAHVIDVFGDSLGDGLWAGLYAVQRHHPQDKLYRHSKVGIGLTSPDYGDWLRDFTQTIDADHPNVVVVMFGANDVQSVRDENHKGYVFESEGWKRVYTARVAAVMSETAKRRIQTVWVGLPIMRKDDINSGALFLNRIFENTANNSGVTFVPLDDAFKSPDGSYTTHLQDSKGHQRQVRADDGIHFTGYGYELIAEKIYPLFGATAAKPAS
jgi:uncharacterized protein